MRFHICVFIINNYIWPFIIYIYIFFLKQRLRFWNKNAYSLEGPAREQSEPRLKHLTVLLGFPPSPP